MLYIPIYYYFRIVTSFCTEFEYYWIQLPVPQSHISQRHLVSIDTYLRGVCRAYRRRPIDRRTTQ